MLYQKVDCANWLVSTQENTKTHARICVHARTHVWLQVHSRCALHSHGTYGSVPEMLPHTNLCGCRFTADALRIRMARKILYLHGGHGRPPTGSTHADQATPSSLISGQEDSFVDGQHPGVCVTDLLQHGQCLLVV
eukprot:865723-Pelagomonas_calceolata.AAC.1